MNKIKAKKNKNNILEDNFFDVEMIYSFFISLIVHVLLAWFFIFILWTYFMDSYKVLIKELFVKPDIIFNLQPIKDKKDLDKEKDKTEDLKKTENK